MLKSLKSTDRSTSWVVRKGFKGHVQYLFGWWDEGAEAAVRNKRSRWRTNTAYGAAGDAQSGFWWDGRYYGGNMWLWNASEDYRMNIEGTEQPGFQDPTGDERNCYSKKIGRRWYKYGAKTPLTFKWHWEAKAQDCLFSIITKHSHGN